MWQKTKKVFLQLLPVLLCVFVLHFDAFAASERENNNSKETATGINVNETVTGTISDYYDEDWYRFTLSEAGKVTFQVDHDALSSKDDYWTIYIYQFDGETYIDEYSSYWDVLGHENFLSPEIGLPAGTYYIKIEDGYQFDDSTYSLKVNYTQTDMWEKESNRNSSNATVIEPNSQYFGSIMNQWDYDWYTFTLAQDGMVTFQLDHKALSSKDDYWTIYIYQFDGETYIDEYSSYWDVLGNENFLSPEIGLPAGTYCIMIERGYGFDSSTYSLKVNYTQTDMWEKESNRNSSNATVIEPNSQYFGSIMNQWDYDWYTFTLAQDGMVTFQMDHEALSSQNEYWRICVYQFDGETPIDEYDSYWDISGHENFLSPEIGLPAGTYYAKITSDSGSDASTYSLTVNYTESSEWEKESNRSSANASSIQPEQTVFGSLMNKKDYDWYRLDLSEAMECTLIFTHAKKGTGAKSWDIELFEFDGTSKIGSTMSVTDSVTAKSFILNELAPGKYYFCVTGGYESSDETYTLTVKEGRFPGWKTESGKRHYYDENGIMVTGWKAISGKTYYFDATGAMVTGWKKIGSWYYFDKNGVLQTGWLKIGKNWYFFDRNGAMQTGWLKSGGKWYYFNKEGAMQTGWLKIGKNWYFINASGVMKTGWLKSGGKWYYFNKDGIMQSGWTKIGSAWYYFQGGAMKTGWLRSGKNWYYFDSEGRMVTGKRKIGAVTYTFSSSGICLNP